MNRAAAEVRDRRSEAMVGLFHLHMRRYLARSFHALRLSGPAPAPPAGRPAVIYSNHPGWWDPAVFIVLDALLFPDRKGFGPMAADQLARYRFMERLGIFGIRPGPEGARRFLDVSTGLLEDPRTMLWITAEGRFSDPRDRPVRLGSGVARLAFHVPGAVLVPLAIEYPFWTERMPEALIRFGEPVEASAAAGPAALRRLLAERLEAAMDALAGDARSRDPGRFRPLVSGSAGVGGIYDMWRRARSALAGRRFRAEHGGEHPGERP